jgi:azurin
MRNAFYIVMLILLPNLLACNIASDEAGNNDNQDLEMESDSLTSPIQQEADTTLQPIVELTLRATGEVVEEMVYDQDTLVAKANSLVKLTFINEGTELPMIHNVVITTPGNYKQVALAGEKVGAPGNYVPKSKEVIAATPLALPGQTVELEFKAPKPGVYDFVCTYPGHWQRMNGKFVVE